MNFRITYPQQSDLAKLSKPLSDCETQVLEYFLRNMPPSWEIYIRPHLNGLAPNFVLLNPQRGIAVYEVRDWEIVENKYFVKEIPGHSPTLMVRQDGVEVLFEQKNPIPKIELYKEEIYTLYCPRLPKERGFGVIISGVIFPRSTREQAECLLKPIREQRGHLDYPNLYPIIGSDNLSDNREWAVKKFVLSSRDRIDNRMDEILAKDLRKWLIPPSQSSSKKQPFLLSNLTPNQKKIVTTRTDSGYRRVRGPAGSGKTLVLAGRAAQLASEGKKVLVITFNITLIKYITELTSGFSQAGDATPDITALNFHFWCKRIAQLTGHFNDYKDIWTTPKDWDFQTKGDFSQYVLREGMATAVNYWLRNLDVDEKWDAILVDEGQDIELLWWRSLRSALKPGGEALLCADKIQNIYEVPTWTEDEMSGAGFRGVWGTLDESYRLSPALCKLAKKFIDDFLPKVDDQRPEPAQMGFEFKTILKWWQIEHGQAAHACVDALIDIIDEADSPLDELDLTCIVANDRIGLQVVSLLMEKGISSIDTFGVGANDITKYYDAQRKKLAFFNGKANVKVTTLHSFKGWESKSLVVHIDRADCEKSLSLAYVGLTRLQKNERGCYLTIVNEAPELRVFGSTWPIFIELSNLIQHPCEN